MSERGPRTAAQLIDFDRRRAGLMQLLWSHDLPQAESLRDSDLEGPIGVFDGKVWFGTADYAYPAEERSVHPDRRGVVLRLDAIDVNSRQSTRYELPLAGTDRTASWTFIDRRLLYCGRLLLIDPVPRLAGGISELNPVAARTSLRLEPVLRDGLMIVSDAASNSVLAYDLNAQTVVWSRHFPSLSPYRMGEATLFGDRIATHGPDGLTLLDPTSGEVVDIVKFPRVDVLYSPTAIEEDVLVGHTNWSTGGVIRYDPKSRRIRWQYKRRFDGPASYRRIWPVRDVVVWVKGETELIGIDAQSGEERWSYRPAPYLYSQIRIVGNNLVFGSAGGDGSVHVVDPATGKACWTRYLKNGCQFYDLHDESIIVGDFEGFLRRLDLRTGREVDGLNLGSEIVGDIAVAAGCAYTVVWPTAERPARLVAVNLDA